MLDVVVYVRSPDLGHRRPVHPTFAIVIGAATLTSRLVSFHPDAAVRQPLFDDRGNAQVRRRALESFRSRVGPWVWTIGDGYRSLLHGVLTGRWRGLSGRWLVIGLGLASLLGGLSLLTTGRIGIDIFPVATRAKSTSPW